ncbi:MAG: sugar phosphate isomerase/epimerase [Phycisphaeraceae bacterium]|nr:MAG: sugar phosphate isomerase/epimerase [Phycisphaeraceae bacterium]
MLMLAGPSFIERVLARHVIAQEREPLFRISLAQWSLHRTLRAGDLEHLDFPRSSREDFGIEAVEYVNTFFARGADDAYIAELRKRCDDMGVRSLLIMCDSEGALGDPDEEKRSEAVSNHHKWVEAAAALGCHSIRVNAQSRGDFEEQQKLTADGLRRLCEFADPHEINVIVENHWGLSSNAAWVVGVMELVDHPRCGTLPDFGNFDPKVYDRYQGVQEMMAWAKGVSAKSYDFDETSGEETEIDYRRMLKIVLLSGYRGFIGIEYEGRRLSERDGILATKSLLERLREEFSRDEEMR